MWPAEQTPPTVQARQAGHPRVCATPGCPDLANTGAYCDTHAAPDRARRNQRVRDHGYSSRNWQTIRAQRLAIAGYRCELQLDGCTQLATHVHLDPALNGNHTIARLEHTKACCPQCSGAIDAPRSHVRLTSEGGT